MTADDDIRSALATLPITPAAPRFWDDLHDKLARAAQEHPAEPTLSAPVELNAQLDKRRGSPRVLLAVAAAVVLVVAGLVWVTGQSSVTPAGPTQLPTSTSRPDLPPASTDPAQVPRRANGAITDPHSINLEAWLDHAPTWPPTSTGPFLIFDTASLPKGWSVDSAGGGSTIPTPGEPVSTSWTAILTSPEGLQYSLAVYPTSSPWITPDSTSTPIKVRGHDGFADAGRIVWDETPSVKAAITAFDSNDHAAEMVALAEALSTKAVERMPSTTTSESHGRPADSLLQLRGTLAGHEWWVQVTTAPPLGMNMSVDGWNSGGGFSLADNAQTTVAGLQLTARGVPGGVIVFGIARSTLASVRVELSDGVTIDLPVYVWTGGSGFAVPIPDGLDAVAIAYLDAAGNVLHRTLLPEFAIPTTGGTSGQSTFDDPAGTNLYGNHAPYRQDAAPNVPTEPIPAVATGGSTATTSADTTSTAATATTTATTTAADVTAPPSAATVNELRQHPDVLPSLAAGQPCPATTDFASLSADLGPMAGNGAARPVGLDNGKPLLITTATDQTADAAGDANIIWALPINAEGPVLVRGHQLDGPGTIQFALTDSGPTADLVLSPAAAAQISTNGITTNELDGGWYEIPTTTTFTNSGCFGFQIDSSTGSSTVIFNTTLNT